MDKIRQIKDLTNELLHHCHLYYGLDAPEISDAEYDKKFDTLKQLEDEANFWLTNSPTRKVQGEVLPYLEKVHHSVPMLSADKSTDIEDVKKFIGNKNVVVSFKLDGSTVVIKYNNGQLIQGLSRGSGTDGENITHTVKMIKNLPITIPYKGFLEIRGEALIPWKYYNAMNADGSLGHPRNVASGALRQLDASEAAKRNIYFYAFTLVNWKEVLDSIYPNRYGSSYKGITLDFLKKQGFDVVPYKVIDNASALKNIEEIISSCFDRSTYELPTDGWCVEYDDLKYGESLGSTEHHDRKLYALKPTRTDYTTHFRGIEYNTCRTGIVSLTALFDPVEIGNTNVTRATLHNIDYFNNLELGEGDEIFVAKMNEIIPAVLDNNTRSNTYELIDKCPSCGTKLIIKNTGTANVLYCPNENCPSKNLAKFTHFVSRNCMNIEGLSEKTLETLITHKLIREYKDIYRLIEHRHQLIQIEGLGEKSVDNLLESIEKSRKVKLENFLAALGIEGIGTSAAKTIAEYFNHHIYAVLDAYDQGFNWTALKDFGSIMANNMNQFLKTNLGKIYTLAEELDFIKPEKVEIKNNPFIGKTLVVTGKLNTFTRESINEKILSLGAKTAGSVSKSTDYLITNESSGSSKYKKAVELNISIIDENTFLKMCEM